MKDINMLSNSTESRQGMEKTYCYRPSGAHHKTVVPVEELFLGPSLRYMTQRGQYALDVLRDLAFGEFAGVAKWKH